MREYRETLRALKRKEKIGLKLGLGKTWKNFFLKLNFYGTVFSFFKLL